MTAQNLPRTLSVAVAGGTGAVGSRVVDALHAAGHRPHVLTRGSGVDLVTNSGLDAALDGVDAVIDAANVTTMSARTATRFFTTATANLVRAAHRAGVRHLVLVSIVGIDRMPHDYYAGKVAQERVVADSPVPWSIVRATQFHEFAAQLFARAAAGPLHIAPRARVQPIAAAEVGAQLAHLATGPAQGRSLELAGPREERLDDMIRRYARRIGHRGPVPALSLPGAQMRGMRAGFALPGAGARLGVQTFDEWLDTAVAARRGS